MLDKTFSAATKVCQSHQTGLSAAGERLQLPQTDLAIYRKHLVINLSEIVTNTCIDLVCTLSINTVCISENSRDS